MMMRTAIVPLLLLAACGGGEEPAVTTTSTYQGDLKDLGPAPEFKFLERAGVPYASDDLKGKVWVASVIFTRCQTHCPLICRELVQLQDAFEGHDSFRIVSVTVDPAYDEPEVLARFAKSWEADPEQWKFLWGKADQIKSFVGQGGLNLGWKDEIINHSLYLVLVGREGRIRGYYMGNDLDRMKKLRADIRALLDAKA